MARSTINIRRNAGSKERGAGCPRPIRSAVEQEFRELVAGVAERSRTMAEIEWRPVRGAFLLEEDCPLVQSFQRGYAAQRGQPLACGAKPFVDDGNSFWALARVPAITHGPLAGGQHTTNEWVSIDDLARSRTCTR